MSAKDELEALQQQVSQKQTRIAGRKADIEWAQGKLTKAQEDRQKAESDLADRRREFDSLKSQVARLKEALPKLQEEKARAEAEQRDKQQVLDTEKEALDSAKSLQAQIAEECSSLGAARTRLTDMFSDAAMSHAMEAVRAELEAPAPAPAAKPAPSGLLRRFKAAAKMASAGFAIKEAAEEEKRLRPARKDLATLLSLHRLLDMHVFDGKECLRQCAFVQVAVKETQEMEVELNSRMEETRDSDAKVSAEREELKRELVKVKTSLNSFKSVHRSLQAKFQEITRAVPACEEALSELEKKRSSLKKSLMQEKRLCERQAFDLERLREQTLETSAALEQHPAEAARRGHAARTLADQADAQLAKAQRDMDRTHKEMQSFKQVHRVLLEAQDEIKRDLESQLEMHGELTAQYQAQSREISAMATSYVEPYPGSGGFRADLGLTTPAGQSASIGAGARLVMGVS